MSDTTTIARPKQPTKDERRRLRARSLAEQAEAKLLAHPATATPPPGGHRPEAVLASAKGVMRVWLMADDEGYRLRLIHWSLEGVGWEMVKWSDGTRYHLFEPTGGDITCDCPGCTAHGPRCAGGRGCKHARMIRALRQVVDPGI